MVRSTEEERVYGETRSGAIQGSGPRSPGRHARRCTASCRRPQYLNLPQPALQLVPTRENAAHHSSRLRSACGGPRTRYFTFFARQSSCPSCRKTVPVTRSAASTMNASSACMLTSGLNQANSRGDCGINSTG
jgi:hypothetical protein